MKKITIAQHYTIDIPAEMENLSPEQLLNQLNRMYDIHGQGIIAHGLDAKQDYDMTTLTHIDDEEVYTDNSSISNEGHIIILDGQPLSDEGDKL